MATTGTTIIFLLSGATVLANPRTLAETRYTAHPNSRLHYSACPLPPTQKDRARVAALLHKRAGYYDHLYKLETALQR
jgi:hypothetical protein